MATQQAKLLLFNKQKQNANAKQNTHYSHVEGNRRDHRLRPEQFGREEEEHGCVLPLYALARLPF